MDRNIVEIAHCNSSTHKSEQCLRLGGLKLKDSSIMKPKLHCKKGSLIKLPNKTTHAIRLNLNERELLSKLVVEAKANASAGDPQETSKPKSKEARPDQDAGTCRNHKKRRKIDEKDDQQLHPKNTHGTLC
jgi:hypothetical protein